MLTTKSINEGTLPNPELVLKVKEGFKQMYDGETHTYKKGDEISNEIVGICEFMQGKHPEKVEVIKIGFVMQAPKEEVQEEEEEEKKVTKRVKKRVSKTKLTDEDKKK